MKYERAETFKHDYRRLPKQQREKFRERATTQFHEAAEAAASGKDKPWPKGLRVKPVQGAKGVWEMTWSMNDPDGRATWEWTEIDGEAGIRWRRIGAHGIFTAP